MKYSLLYKKEEEHRGNNVIYDLSIDKSVANMSEDLRRNEYFLTILSRPLINVENIIYRQEILKDFLNIPELYENVKTIFNRYDKMKSDWIELRTGTYSGTKNINSDALLDYTYSSLKVTALFPKTIVSFFYSIYETLSGYDIKSEGLNLIKDYCNEMINNESLNEIARIAAKFQYNTPEDYTFDVVCELDDALKLRSCEISGINEIKTHDNKSILGLLGFKKQRREDTINSTQTSDEQALSDLAYILSDALHHIDTLLTQITNSIYGIFYGISRELYFYECALSYIKNINAVGLPLVTPTILHYEEDCFIAEDLYDVLLASEATDRTKLIPNDITINRDMKGLLIRGKNNTGKTTFLRSVGTAQLFAQAGLPIIAKSAKLSVRTNIFTHFSSAEEDFEANDKSGRFEGEVKLIAQIVDSITPHSLVLLNETFQTTSYDEGTEGIFNIISVFPKAKVQYIFVTHLEKLFDRLDDNVIKLESYGRENLYKFRQLNK